MAKRNYLFYRLLMKETDEWHLFGIYKVIDPKTQKIEWKITKASICNKMEISDKKKNSAKMSENIMRRYAATIGRSVCGTCISHLYLTLE